MQESIHETAVWDRVTAASRNAAEKPAVPGPIGPELLSALEEAEAAETAEEPEAPEAPETAAE